MNYKNFVIQPLIRKKNFFFKKADLKKKTKNLTLLIIGGSQSARKFDSLFNNDLIKLSKKLKLKFFIKQAQKI